MTVTSWLKSLFAKLQPVQPLRLASELIRRMDIAYEATELKAKIDRLRKNKKKFSHLEARLIELRSELLKLDAS